MSSAIKLTVPSHGEKITICGRQAAGPGHDRSCRSSRATAPGRTSGARRVRVLDAAVAKAYGGKRKIQWMEVYAGQKSNDLFNTWLPDETVDACREYLVVDQGPADDADRRRHPLAQRRAAADARSLRLPASGALVQGRAFAGARHPTRSTW